VNCFCQCGYVLEFNTEADLDSCSKEDNRANHEEWIWLDTQKEVYHSSYVSPANELATCTISSSNELYDDCKGGRSNEGEEE
jgi:hypothetical protein